jgi:hypothetical protein
LPRVPNCRPDTVRDQPCSTKSSGCSSR